MQNKNNVLLCAAQVAALFVAAAVVIFGCSKESSNKITHEKSETTARAVTTTPLPGGRAYYTVAKMGGPSNQKFTILAQYSFTASSSSTGYVSRSDKYWDQVFGGNGLTNKVSTGYYTGTCTMQGNCVVKTPVGYQPGQPWSGGSGSYYIDVNGRLVINWNDGGKRETWTITNGSNYSKLTIYNSNYNLAHGWGFGSNQNFNTAATMTQIKAFGGKIYGEEWYNAYNQSDVYKSGSLQYFNMDEHILCNTNVLRKREYGAVCDWDASYLAGNAGTDKRKLYWNRQRGSVKCDDTPGSLCISPEGGHTVAALQIIDDNGQFRGFVGTEASLHGYYNSGAIVGVTYYFR